MITFVGIVLCGMLGAGDSIEIVDAWTISVNATPLVVDKPEHVQVRDEVHTMLPVYNSKGAGYNNGAKLRQLRAEECSTTDLLYPETLRLKATPGQGREFAVDQDYAFEPRWATFGRVEGSTILPRQAIYVDYEYDLNRIDSIVIGASGDVRLVKGESGTALVYPPQTASDERVVANVWVPGRCQALSDENLYPVAQAQPQAAPAPGQTQAETFLPKTLAKLRAGEPVTIVAFGDSVTDGGGTQRPEEWYQNQFAALLRARFPRAQIRIINAGWGGASSKQYLTAPAGGTYDFVRDVLDPKPDLVTLEFVNDAGLDEAGVAEHYKVIMDKIHGGGAELALITPHLIRPDWMKIDTMKFDEDPRAYVRGLKQFAKANNIALADGSAGYLALKDQGIPYITLMANNINHPDARGHAIFAKALMDMFPKN